MRLIQPALFVDLEGVFSFSTGHEMGPLFGESNNNITISMVILRDFPL